MLVVGNKMLLNLDRKNKTKTWLELHCHKTTHLETF